MLVFSGVDRKMKEVDIRTGRITDEYEINWEGQVLIPQGSHEVYSQVVTLEGENPGGDEDVGGKEKKAESRGGEEKPVRIQRLTWNDNANRRRAWMADFPLDARGCRVGIDRFFIWEPGGELKLLRFSGGRQVRG